MSNQSIQPVQIKSAPANLYTYNRMHQVHSGFATVNAVQKKEKTSISSIFNWKKDKVRTAPEQQAAPTLYGGQPQYHQAYPVVQYAPAPNYIIDSNQKFMQYNSIYKPTADAGYLQFPSTIHATIRYLPNHKQRTNILATNWEPATTLTYPAAYPPNQQMTHSHNSSVTGHQPITLQHEITYSEQITIAPSCLTHACLNKNQSCKCYNENKNFFLVPTNSSLLESSSKLHNKSTDCMMPSKKLSLSQSKHSSIRGSKSHHNLNLDESNSQLNGKKKGNKFAATVNERFLRIFKKSIRDPFNTVKSPRKSILDCDLTAYDLVTAGEEEESKENNDKVNGKLNGNQKINLDSSLEEDQLDENRFETNFMQAKAKQKQHYYSPFEELNEQQANHQTNQSNKEDKNCTKNLNLKTNCEEDRWSTSCPLQSSVKPNLKAKFNSCRIAGQGIKFAKRMSILESDLSKEFLKEELSEDEDLNRLDRYAQNFDNLDKQENIINFKSNKLTKFNDLNNFRLFSSSAHNSSIPNLPDPDYDTDEDEDDDRNTLTMFSRSTPDLDQSLENEKRKRSTFTNTTSLYNLDQSSFKDRPPCLPPPPLPKARSQQLIFNNPVRQSIQSSDSPSSSTYSSFNSSINSNVKSILKKSNPNLVLLEHLKAVDLFDRRRKDAKLNNGNNLLEESRLTKRCLLNKSVTTFKGNNYEKKLDDFKPKKSVHFRSSFNDELIVEHIDNQEELIEEEEQIYDDIVITRLKQTIDNEQSMDKNIDKNMGKNMDKNIDKNTDKNIDKNKDKNTDKNIDKNIENEVKKEEKDESKESGFLKLDNSEGRNYSNNSSANSSLTKSDSGEYFDALLTNEENKIKESNSFLCTGKFNNSSLIKDRPMRKNQSSQLPNGNSSSFEFKKLRDNNSSEYNQFLKTKFRNGDLDELQSTALVKQNRNQLITDSTNSLFKQQIVHSSCERDKNLDLLQSLTESTNLTSNLSTNLTSNLISNLSANLKSSNTKEDHNLFNREDNQQMSPSSSSSTSAYVSLYASSSFSSAGSSSSNYSTSGFNENSNCSKEFNSDSSSKKISRSAILDSLINRKHNNKLLDKPFDRSLLKSTDKLNDEKMTNQQANKDNKIVIDISMNNYDSLNQSIQNEHIYEELNECSFEREINIIDNLNNNLNSVKKSIFEGASKDQIIEYLVDAKERIQELLINNYNEQYSSQQNKFSSLSTSCHNIASNRANRRARVSNLSNVSSDSSSSSDILINTNSISNSIGQHLERNDSGVGAETSKPSLDIRMSKSEACLNELIDNHLVHSSHFDDQIEDNEDERILSNRNKTITNCSGAEEQICADCDQQNVCAEVNEKGLIYYPLLCSKCDKRRTERKEIIAEFVDTEFKYGRDLRIIRDQFYRHIEIANLLTKDQLKSVFLNLDELIQVNSKFSEKLQDAIDIATEQGDEDYTTVDIGKLFNESCDMLKSFETYCIKQASASRLLGQLEKDKEFLRIFLRVSQMENVLLRRMNLSAFLMVPVQRVTKYPLLLNRLFKVTPYHHNDRGRLKEAQLKVEMYLEQINQQTKGTVPNKIWRRISNLSNNSTSKRSNLDELGDVKLKKFNSSVRELFKAFKGSSRS